MAKLITVRPDKASRRSRIDLAYRGTVWGPAGLVRFPWVELRLVGPGVCITAISGRHARNEAGESANRQGGKEGRQCVFHVKISERFDHENRSAVLHKASAREPKKP